MEEKILQTAYLLYSRYGIKGVSMNQISRSLGISKTTLYEAIGSKENLINACVEKDAERVEKAIINIENKATSSIQAILMISNNVFNHYASMSPSFYKDLSRFFEANDKHISYKEKLYNKYNYYLKKGIEEGNFISGVNYERTTAFFIEQIGKLEIEYQTPMLITFLRGICTSKGLIELEQLCQDIPKNQTIKI